MLTVRTVSFLYGYCCYKCVSGGMKIWLRDQGKKRIRIHPLVKIPINFIDKTQKMFNATGEAVIYQRRTQNIFYITDERLGATGCKKR